MMNRICKCLTTYWPGWLLVGAAGLSLMAQPAWADNAVLITTNYYSVSGSSIPEIMASVEQTRPWKTNFAFAARTEWQVDWTFRFARGRDNVRVDDITTKTTIQITMPRWDSPPDASEELRQGWQKYFAGLFLHELGHVRLALEAATEIRRQVSTLTNFNSVAELRDTVNSTAEEVLHQFRRRELEYDRLTRHGVTQGAHWFGDRRRRPGR